LAELVVRLMGVRLRRRVIHLRRVHVDSDYRTTTASVVTGIVCACTTRCQTCDVQATVGA
jgi:hypothetical protein